MTFQATHEITVTDRGNVTTYLVMLREDESGWSRGYCAGEYRIGPAYTEAEWNTGAPADWELTKFGWRFKGRTSPTNHSTVFIKKLDALSNHAGIIRLNEIWSQAAAIRNNGLKAQNVAQTIAAASVMNFITIGRSNAERLANGPDGLPSDYYSNLVTQAETRLQDAREKLTTL